MSPATIEANVWTRIGPAVGMTQLAIDPVTPATLYAGTTQGVFKSTDGGAQWSLANAGLPEITVRALAMHPVVPATLYALSWNGSLFKSTDGASSWSEVDTGQIRGDIWTVAASAASPGSVYVGTNGDGGVWASVDEGQSWSEMNAGLSNRDVVCLVIDPRAPSTLYAGTNGGGVFKTTDGGQHWTGVNDGLSASEILSLAIDPAAPATLYAGTYGGGVFKTSDGGVHWSASVIELSAGDHVFRIDTGSPGTAYMMTYGGDVLKSVDAGATWQVGELGLGRGDVVAIVTDPARSQTLYAVTAWGGGVFKSTDGGGSWYPSSDGLVNGALVVTAISIDPSSQGTLFLATYGDGAFHGTPGRWEQAERAAETRKLFTMVIDPATPGVLYAGTERDGMYKSTDGGASWHAIAVASAISAVYVLTVDPVTPATVYAGIDGGMIKSLDAGATWQAIDEGLSGHGVVALAIDPQSPSLLYAGTDTGVFKSTDGGSTWNQVTGDPLIYDVRALAIEPSAPATVYAATGVGGVFKSTNSGETWRSVNAGLTSTEVWDVIVDPHTPQTIYAALPGSGVFRSTNGGDSWHAMSAGLDHETTRAVLTLAAHPSTPNVLYAGSSGGLLMIRLDPDTLAEAVVPPAAPPPTAAPSPTPVDWRISVDSLANRCLEDNPLAGLTIAIRQRGEPDWVQAYGLAEIALSIPATPDTVYQIGSLSMPFTAAAVMQLVEQDVLDLSTPIAQYLQNLPPQLQTVTLDQLLSHTSGIADSGETLDMFTSDQIFTFETLIRDLVPTLSIDPSQAHDQYISYGNYILAGLIVESVSGLSYGDYVATHLFAPARMHDTTYCIPAPAETADGYYYHDQRFEPIPVNVSAFGGSGSLCGTAGDLLLWMEALTSGKIVRPESYRQMLAPSLSSGGSQEIGYGLYADQDEYGVYVGYVEVEGFLSFVLSYPEEGLTVALLSNTASSEAYCLEVMEDLIPLLMAR